MTSDISTFATTEEIESDRMFYLLNKDNLLARFHVAGKGPLETVEIDEQFAVLPEWISV